MNSPIVSEECVRVYNSAEVNVGLQPLCCLDQKIFILCNHDATECRCPVEQPTIRASVRGVLKCG